MKFLTYVLALALGVASAASCAKARAQTVPDGPPLAVPPPPDRVIAPPEEPVLAAAPPTEAPNPEPPSVPPRTPQTAKPSSTPSTPPPAVATTPPPIVPPVVEPPKPSPPTAADLAAERRIRDILRRATRDTGRVTYNRLSPARRSLYDQSKSLSEQAEEAIKDRNWTFAEILAAKAATLAADLVGR